MNPRDPWPGGSRVTFHNERAEGDALAGQILRQTLPDADMWTGRVIHTVRVQDGKTLIAFTDGSWMRIAGVIEGGDPAQDPNATPGEITARVQKELDPPQ